jgi:hypothetical protein
MSVNDPECSIRLSALRQRAPTGDACACRSGQTLPLLAAPPQHGRQGFETTFEPIPTQVRFNILWHRRMRAPFIPIDTQRPGRVGPLRGFLPRGLSNACPHAPSRIHAAADKGRRRTTLNKHGRSCLKTLGAGYSHAMLTIKLFP